MWPLLLGLAGALAGVLWAIGIHFSESNDVWFSQPHRIVIGVLAIGAGLVAGYAYWDNQDVWTVGDNGWATLVAGFTASTTGALAGVTSALFSPSNSGRRTEELAPAQG